MNKLITVKTDEKVNIALDSILKRSIQTQQYQFPDKDTLIDSTLQ